MQTTLAGEVRMAGIGLFSGVEARVVVAPAGPGAGVVFDTPDGPVPALAAHVADASRCTMLAAGSARVCTVEHVLSALAGCGIDNARVAIDGPEVPILDGSAAVWADAFAGAGMCEQTAPRRVLRVTEPILLQQGDSWYVAAPAPEFSVTCVVSYDHPMLGSTAAAYAGDTDGYRHGVAPARTYALDHEVQALLASGMVRGGSLDNALVVYADRFSAPLRLPEEWTRHKLLDLIGDLSLAGGRIQASITAIKPGHRANTLFAARLAAAAPQPAH